MIIDSIRRQDGESLPKPPKPLLLALAVGFAAFALYLATLAPTMLWGDDAELQRLTFTGGATSGAHAHPLWVWIANAFARLPIGDVAWRANLISAVFGAIAVLLVCASAWVLTRSAVAAALSAGALGVSHTFWLHAVRAEVYMLYMAMLASIVFLLLLWRERLDDRLLVAAALLSGLATLSHLLILTALPAVAMLIWRTPKRRLLRTYLLAIVALALGASPYLVYTDGGAAAIGASGTATLAGLAVVRPQALALWLGFLSYQFLAATALGLLGMMRLWWADRVVALFLTLLFLGDVIFTLTFQAPDQYVFYLPSYLVFALWVGVGVAVLRDWAPVRRHSALLVVVALVVIVLPPLVYRLTPIALNRIGANPLAVRSLPNRDNNTFFLYPPKNGYRGARDFAEAAMRDLPPNAAVLADWLPLQTLLYLQEVEGVRRDVTLVEIYAGRGQQVPWLLEQRRSRPVFIAATGRYYDMAEIEQVFKVRPFGVIYQLEPIEH